jgi:transcriptional regulator with XRE-family HTH domain
MIDGTMALAGNFRVNVRKRRQELGLTQKALADRMGVSRAYVAQIETEDQNRSLEVVDDFAKGLQCAAVALLLNPEEEAAVV